MSAIVTGSGRGIGRAIALRLAREGVKVVVNAKKGYEDVIETINMIKSVGGEAIPVLADVSTREGCRELVRKAMESLGRLDILVNNAGLGLYASFLEQSDAMIEKVLSTSLKSVIYCSQEAAKVMTEGSIINIASIAGIEPLYGLSIYSAAKAGVIGITKALAIELAPRIRVNAIAPGIVKTKMGESLLKVLKLTEEEYLEKYTLLKKFIEPNEIADAVIFLIKTPSITGQTIVIDAGLSLITFRFSM
ncbi:MAG: SDR family oxidoreductase [Acidilobaceae archaeon]